MDEKSNRKAGFGSIEDRIRAFRDRMAPALHLFPQDIAEKLTEGGFFTAPASTKYHGAYEGGLFDHSRNVTSALVTLTHDNDLEWQVQNFVPSMKAAGSMSPIRCSRDMVINLSYCSPSICS